MNENLPFSSGATKSEREEEVEEEESEAIKRVLSRLADGIGGESPSRSGADCDDYDDDEDDADKDTFPSQLNQGRRLDYVLQVSYFGFVGMRLFVSMTTTDGNTGVIIREGS